MSVIVVGLNHRSVSLDVLERMTIDESDLAKALYDLANRTNISEVVLLSTCMRTEIYAVMERFHGAMGDIRDFLVEISGVDPNDFNDHLYSYYEQSAVSHLFNVTAGLDSAILGEGEILGQVRTAWEKAREEGTSGPVLSSLFRHSIEVGKRARSETAISRGITSVSQAAVAMSEEILGHKDNLNALVIGAGDMGKGITLALAANGASVTLANRGAEKAAALAAAVGANTIALSQLNEAAIEVDIIFTSTRADSLIFTYDDLVDLMLRRNQVPLVIVDVAVPRDIDSSASTIEGLQLLDLDSIRAFAEAGMAGRRKEAEKVAYIVDEEVLRYIELTQARQVSPLIHDLRERADHVREKELERYKGRLQSLSVKDKDTVEALTRGIINKLLHNPTIELKSAAGTPKGERLADVVRVLFDL